MTAFEIFELVGFAGTAFFGLLALWKHRGDTTELGARRRKRVYGILLGMSLLPIHVFLRDELSVGVIALVVAFAAGGSILLINRS